MRNILNILLEYIINLFNSNYQNFRAKRIVKLRIFNTK